MVALSAALAACSLLFQLDPPAQGRDAGLLAIPDAPPFPAGDSAPPPGCPLQHWPERPSADDPSGGDVDLTFAVQTVELGLGDAGPAPGFDLDGLCTCPDAPSCVGPGPMCDRDGGVDDGVADLLLSLSSFGKVVDPNRVNQYIAWGHNGMLLVLHHYNGTPNDRSVELAFFVSDGTPLDDAGYHVPAKFDGTDVWTLNRSSILAGKGPPFFPVFFDTTAYVAGGVLVARAEFPFVISGLVNLTARVQSGVLVARIVRDALPHLEDGVIAGRWATRDALTALAAFDDPFVDGGKLCGSSLTYQAVKPRICGSVDIAARPADDRTGARCDAFSLGFGFRAVAAVAGGLGPVLDGGFPCGVGYQDDCAN